MNKLLVILGPTATGKTDIGLKLASGLEGEIIACDSRQLYKGLDIGSGKEPGKQSIFQKGDGLWIIDGIKVWLYDIAEPSEQYTVWDYINAAAIKADEISREKKLPVVVGGSGLYLRTLLEGMDYSDLSGDKKFREELEAEDLEKLQKKLFSVSPAVFNSLNNSDRNNKRRLIRKIELLTPSLSTDSVLPAEAQDKSFKGIGQDYDVLKIGISCPKEILDHRIDVRVDKRIRQGMIEEARLLHTNGNLSLIRMRQLGLEYGVLADFLEGKYADEEEMAKVLKNKIHQFAKRQITWFKKEADVDWFDITDPEYLEKVEKRVSDWYNS